MPEINPAADDDKIHAAILEGLRCARTRLGSANATQAAAAERQVTLLVGYIASLAQSRGVSIPAVVLFSAPVSVDKLVDQLIQALEESATKTRCLPLFIAGVACGYALGKAIAYAFG
jgi:hypothetical protein